MTVIHLATSCERAEVIVLERPRSIAAGMRMCRERSHAAKIAYVEALREDAKQMASSITEKSRRCSGGHAGPIECPLYGCTLHAPACRPPRRSLRQWIIDILFRMGERT